VAELRRRASPGAALEPSGDGNASPRRGRGDTRRCRHHPRQNPLELEAGPRLVGENVESAVFSAALTETFDLGGVGHARAAPMCRPLARADGETRFSTRTSPAFVRGLWAEQRALANESQRIAKTVHEATKKRVRRATRRSSWNVARGGCARLADPPPPRDRGGIER
jgi:hypothetical protein